METAVVTLIEGRIYNFSSDSVEDLHKKVSEFIKQLTCAGVLPQSFMVKYTYSKTQTVTL